MSDCKCNTVQRDGGVWKCMMCRKQYWPKGQGGSEHVDIDWLLACKRPKQRKLGTRRSDNLPIGTEPAP